LALEVATLRAGDLVARWLPGAGMVGASLRHRGRELLGQRGGLEAYVARGSTFGVPLLHPWANRLGGFTYQAAGRTGVLEAGAAGVRTEEHGLPIHGLLAASPDWRVTAKDDRELVAELVFAERPAFPYPHALRLGVALEPATLTVTLTLTPTGDVAVPIAFGFHPYLAIREDERDACTVTLPARSRLPLDDRGLPTGERVARTPSVDALGDRDELLGDLTGDPFVLDTPERAISVELDAGYPYAQVFTPAASPVACFEPMTAPTNALRSGDGLRLATEPFTAVFSITVEGD